MVLFVGALICLDFWQCLPWVSKPGWILCFCALSPVYNGFPRFTRGATPADPLMASMKAMPFYGSMYLYMYIQALVGLKPGKECADPLLNELCRFGGLIIVYLSLVMFDVCLCRSTRYCSTACETTLEKPRVKLYVIKVEHLNFNLMT